MDGAGSSASTKKSRFRIDSGELAPPRPHAFDLPEISDIRRLAKWLDRDDLTLEEFGEKLERHPGLSRYVIAMANHVSAHREADIQRPIHASAYLGITRLQRIFGQLAAES